MQYIYPCQSEIKITWVFSCKFAAFFQTLFSLEYLCRTASGLPKEALHFARDIARIPGNFWDGKLCKLLTIVVRLTLLDNFVGAGYTSDYP